MQVSGNHFWMRNWAQNAARQKANSSVNPLLEQVQNVMAWQGDSKTSGAVTKEMEAKLLQLEEESKIDPADKALGRAMKQLASVDQEMYGALFNARLELRDLVDKQEAFTNILNGTADYDKAVNDWYIDYEDRDRFTFTDFDTYLTEKGYQGDATKAIDFLTAEWTTVENSMGMSVGLLPGQILVKGPNGTLDKVIYEDQAPLYEQWQEDKKAFEVAALKEYAAEKLPQVQKSIEDFPMRLNQIVMAFEAEKAAIIEKLPKDALKGTYLDNMKSISDFAEKIKIVRPGDGKALLKLLNQMMDKQRENSKSFGGVANDGFSGRLKNGRVEIDLHA